MGSEKQVIAVGSMRRPKVEAVREAMGLLGSLLLAPAGLFEIIGVDVPSGVNHTPLSREETMEGARQRALALVEMARAKGENWKYFVGMEGGLDVIAFRGGRLVFLQNWVYVTDGETSGYGQSGGVLLPEGLAKSVVDEGVELAHAIDAYAGQHGIRDGQGAWGILTGGVITRQDAFQTAVVSAFAPFIHRANNTTASAMRVAGFGNA